MDWTGRYRAVIRLSRDPPHRTWPHDGDGGCVSRSEGPRNWQQRVTMPWAVRTPYKSHGLAPG
jgi:hypothetical protein